MSKHSDFIRTPIITILKEAINIAEKVSNGIEMHPLYDYVIQTTFLKMTGFQEQKLKCIQWELATDNYEYRHREISKNGIRGYSEYDDKNDLYKDLFSHIVFNENEIEKIKNKIKTNLTEVSNIYEKSILFTGYQKQVKIYKDIWSKIKCEHFFCENKKSGRHLLSPNNFDEKNESLCYIYKEYLYKHRNRIAHNIVSYQQNLPSLKSLIDEKYKYNNYFLWFSILILIDNIFIELYNKYRELSNEF